MKPILKLYRGYANEQELIVMGHVFNPLQLKNIIFRKESKKCDLNVMFQIKTQANAVYLDHNNVKIHTKR
jgi:hypothetical protein